ncbi:MAG: transposase [Xenococcus sp. (in: cyanobacteria)]
MSQNQHQDNTHNSNNIEKSLLLTAFQRKLLQKNLQQNLGDKQRQRIQIMLLADQGKTQAQICQELGCCQATARHWIAMARTNQAHNSHFQPIGRPTKVNEQYLERLKQLVSQGPQSVNVPHTNYQYPFRRWTAQKLNQHLKKELGIELTPQHINRLLKQMGLSTRSQPTSPKTKDCPNNIQIADLDSNSLTEPPEEIWHFNPLAK